MKTKTLLTSEQITQLRKCESIIKKGEKAFLSMCEAFQIIERNELWKATHKSFPSYCKDRWRLDATTVSRYIKSAEVLDDLNEFDDQPTNEGQCRTLGRIEPDKRSNVWTKVLESDDKPTAKLIQNIADEHGLIKKEEQKDDAPPKETSVLSNLASTVNVLEHIENNAAKLNSDDVNVAIEYASRCRELLVLIEKKLAI